MLQDALKSKSLANLAPWGRSLASLTVVLLSSALVLLPAPSASAASTKCASAKSPPYTPAETQTRLSPANERTTKPPAINFGTSRDVEDIAPYTFTVAGPAPDPTKMSWDLLLVDGNRTFPDSHASVKFSNAVGNLRMTVCLTPKGVASGSYSGSLTLAGPGVEPKPVPLTVNLKDNNLLVILVGVIVAAFAAVFFKWWTVKVTDKNAANGPNVSQFVKWLKAQWVTVAIAVIGAAGGIYFTKFHTAESFVPSDRLGLWGATFTAVMSASLLLNALGLAVEPKKGETAKAAH